MRQRARDRAGIECNPVACGGAVVIENMHQENEQEYDRRSLSPSRQG
jgi:hypothetical protein